MCLAACPLWAQTTTTLKLVDGGTVAGRLVTFQDQSIKVALEGGENPVYTNVPWARLTQETLQRSLDVALENVRRLEAGKPLLHRVA